MSVTAVKLAELVDGDLVGDRDVVIHSARTFKDAGPGDITFLETPDATRLRESRASAIVIPSSLAPRPFPLVRSLIRVDDPLFAFAVIARHLHGEKTPAPTGIDPRAVIHPSARIGAEASIGPFTVIGSNTTIGAHCRLHTGAVVGKDCRLGDDVVLYSKVVLYDDTIVGDRVILHTGAVLGADGFGYRLQAGRYVKIPQLGNVVLGDDVEVGADTTIDRATFGTTRIGDGTKIDNLVQIAHNCQIGKHNLFGSQVGIAGSARTDDGVTIGEQSGIKDKIHIGAGATVRPKTGVIHDMPPGARWFLYPAYPEDEALRILDCLKELPNFRKTLLRVLKQLKLDATEPEAASA